MNRNVTIVVVILVLVVIAGYLVWLRSKVAAPVVPVQQEQAVETPEASPSAALTASPSATPAREATGPARQRTAAPAAR